MPDDTERKKIIKKFFWMVTIIILLSISLAILFLGKHKPKTYVGKIFDQKISSEEFQETYQHLRIQATLSYGKMFDTLEPILNLRNKTWEQLMLLYEARKRGIKVEDQKIVDLIAQYEVFYDGNQFNPDRYEYFVKKSLKATPREFEESIRDSLMIEELTNQVVSAVPSQEEKLLEEFKKRNEKIQASYIIIASEKFVDQVVLEEQDLLEYYQKHKTDLIMPPSINVEYIRLDFPEEGGVQKQVENKFKAYAIYNDYLKNPNLKELGEQYKFPARQTGYFSRETPNLDVGWSQEIMLGAFDMDVGLLSQPIEFEKGFFIFKVIDKKSSYLPALAKVSDRIKEILTSENAKHLAEKDAQQYLEKIKQQLDINQEKLFEQITEELGLTVETTPLLAKEEILFELGVHKNFKEKLFSLNEKGTLSDVILTRKGACIIYVKEWEGVSQEVMDNKKEDFTKQILREKKDDTFEDFVDQLKIRAGLEIYEQSSSHMKK